MVENCWLGLRRNPSAVFSMRSAKAPAALFVSCPWTVALLTKAALTPETPADSSGMADAAKGAAQAGWAASRVAPLGRQFGAALFAWSIRNEFRMGAASIWFAL